MTDTTPTRIRKEVNFRDVLNTALSVECVNDGTMVFFFLFASADGYEYGTSSQTRTPYISQFVSDLEHYTRSHREVQKSGSGYTLETRVVVTIPEVEYTEDEAMDRLREDWGADPWDVVKDRYQQAVEDVEASARAENTAYQANIAVRHFRERLLQQAKKSSRYVQRLAALRAELEAEVKVQFEEKYDEFESDLAHDLTLDLVDDHVQEVVMNTLRDNLPEAPAGFKMAPRSFLHTQDFLEE